MGAGILILLLYFSLILGVVIGIKTKSCHQELVILVFSSTFVVGIKYNGSYIAVVSWLFLSVLSSYLFYFEYEKSLSRREEDESIGDVILGYLIGFFILLFLKLHGAGWVLSLLASYWAFHLMLLIDYGKNRRAFYLLKIPWVILSLGALIEEFGFQKDLVPFLIVYALIFVIWLKFDLPRLWKPPRIT